MSVEERKISIKLPEGFVLDLDVYRALATRLYKERSAPTRDERGHAVDSDKHQAFMSEPRDGAMEVTLRGEWTIDQQNALEATILAGLSKTVTVEDAK